MCRETIFATEKGRTCQKLVFDDTAMLASKPIKEQGYRSLFGLLSLAKKDGCGKARLEQACESALAMTSQPSYTMIKRIWTECEATELKRQRETLGDKGFVRGSGYFAEVKEDKDGR